MSALERAESGAESPTPRNRNFGDRNHDCISRKVPADVREKMQVASPVQCMNVLTYFECVVSDLKALADSLIGVKSWAESLDREKISELLEVTEI